MHTGLGSGLLLNLVMLVEMALNNDSTKGGTLSQVGSFILCLYLSMQTRFRLLMLVGSTASLALEEQRWFCLVQMLLEYHSPQGAKVTKLTVACELS